MKFTIKSRALKRDVTFSIPGKVYIYADLNGQPGTLGNQICHGGSLMGSTMTYSGDDESEFSRICRKWFRAYLRDTAWERNKE